MANDVQTTPEPVVAPPATTPPPSDASMTSLVAGIVGDAQELLKQQLALFQAEIKDDLQKTKEAAISLAIGAGVAVVGGLLLCFMLVHLIDWAVPALGGPALPLWVSFGLVGGAFTLVGGAFVYAGIRKFRSFNPLPDQSVDAMKENVQWIVNRK